MGRVWDSDQDLSGWSCREACHYLPCAQTFPGTSEPSCFSVRFSTLSEIVLNFTQRSRRLISRLNFSQTGTGPSTDPSALKGGKSVVSEFYDEIIFQDPTQYIQVHPYITQTSPDQYSTIILQPLLTTTRQLTMGAHKHETDFEVGNRTSKLEEKVLIKLDKTAFHKLMKYMKEAFHRRRRKPPR